MSPVPGDPLAGIYEEPDPLASAEQLARAHHDDLPQLSLKEIDAERILSRFRWALLIHRRQEPSEWLVERIALLDQSAARLRRQQGAGR